MSPSATTQRRSKQAEFGTRAASLAVTAGVLFALVLGFGFMLTGTGVGAAIEQVDIAVLQWLADHRTPALDAASATDLASTTVVLVGGLAVAVVASLLLRHWWPAVLMAVALLGELAMFLSSATIVGRPRPPVAHLDPALPPTSSFPSGHTAAAICLYGGVAAIVLVSVRAWWRWLVLAAAVVMVLVVAAARVYRAAHFPSDIVGGALLAVPWLVVTTLLVRPRER